MRKFIGTAAERKSTFEVQSAQCEMFLFLITAVIQKLLMITHPSCDFLRVVFRGLVD